MKMLIQQNQKKVGQTILETLSRAGVEIESHCKSGFCGACRCKKLSGDVQYIAEPIAFLRANEILACCSVAETNVEIEV